MTLSLAAELYCLGMIVVSAYFFILAAANVLEMKICTSRPSLKEGPFVSVFIPVRNEEKNIERCIDSLLNQDYRDYEILVLDDNSDDNTYMIIRKLEEKDKRVRAFKGGPLPEDWYGKPFAHEQMLCHARGEILLLTDADTIHSPTSISWAVTNMKSTGADLISGFAGQILKTFGESVTVPLIFFLSGFLIPMFLNRFVRLGYFSLAVGQYIVLKKEVLLKTGGFSIIKKKTSEDVFLARHIKKSGYKTEFLDISNQVFCRMYDGYRSGIQGIGKNIYDFFRKNTPVLILNALAIFLFFCLPFPILIFSLVWPANNPFLLQLVIVHVIHTLTWLVLFLSRGIPWYNAFTWPLMYFNLLFMVLWSFYRTLSGRGFIWKDRVVR